MAYITTEVAMAPSLHSPVRFGRSVLLTALLPIAAALFLAACTSTDQTQATGSVAQLEAGDLSGIAVDIHQAVG